MAAIRPPLAPRPGWSERTLQADQLLEDLEDRPTDVGARTTWTSSTPVGERDRGMLIRVDGTAGGEPFSLAAGGALRIGRSREMEIRIEDDGVSRNHAVIEPDPAGGWVISDLGSSNGTRVQGEKVARKRLHDGDVIHLGPRISFRFAMVDAEQQTMMIRLYESSTRDALTGCASRKHFDERLRSEVAAAVRHRSELSLLMIDVDHFKKVNDTHGHPAGDAVLRFIAATIQNRLRTEDLLGRWGGEEFAILLRASPCEGGARAAERLRVTIANNTVMFDGVHIPVTVSIGCASLACASQGTGETLLRVADRRLYAAKRTGRNRVVSTD
ncbi:MAG: GGDEF domain-containing protein [Polyangiaceae bacterium]